MNKTVYRIASLILAFAMIFGNIIHIQAEGSVYYVSPTGNDANAGTSSAPFKTFAKANSMLTAGSTLNIYAGTYNEQLKISKSGTSSAWITVKSVGGTVIIDMRNVTSPAVNLPGSYIALSNLDVKGSNDICVRLAGKYLRVSGLTVHECQTHGIYTNGQHVEITGNTAYRASLSNQSRSLPSGWASGIKVALGGDDILITNNKVYHNYGEGIAATRGSNVVIRNNTVYDNFSVNVYMDNSFNVWAEKNMITCHPNSGFERNGSPAIGVGIAEEFYTDWGAKLNRVTIANNIVAFCKHGVRYNGADDRLTGGGLKNSTIAYNTLYGSISSALSIVYESAQGGTLIADNIIWQAENKLTYIDSTVGLTFQNNLWKVLPTAAVRSPGDRVGDPQFATTPGYTPESYRPSTSSPAGGGAADVGISSDFFSASRGPAFDTGAIQFTSGPLAPIPSATASLTAVAPTNTVLSPTPQNTATPIPSMIAASPTALPPTAIPTQTNLPAITATASNTTMPTNTSSVNSLTFAPVADSYVDSSNVTANYGSATTFRVDGSPLVLSFLRFNVQGVNGAVTRATLRIFANSAASAGVVANSVSDNTWSESTLNYNNAPPVGNALGSSGPVSAGTWISVDLTAYVTGNGAYNLSLSTPGSTAISLASRESGANAPQLILQVSP